METPLFTYCVWYGCQSEMCEDRSCADYLISQGARYDDGNNEGKTVGVVRIHHSKPIWYAVAEDFDDMVSYYLGTLQ